MPGRVGNQGSYRYQFQGQEGDDEHLGTGNSYAFKYRIHDARIGKFLSIDPLAPEYPFYSPYSFSGNRLIDSYELEGLEPVRGPVTGLRYYPRSRPVLNGSFGYQHYPFENLWEPAPTGGYQTRLPRDANGRPHIPHITPQKPPIITLFAREAINRTNVGTALRINYESLRQARVEQNSEAKVNSQNISLEASINLSENTVAPKFTKADFDLGARSKVVIEQNNPFSREEIARRIKYSENRPSFRTNKEVEVWNRDKSSSLDGVVRDPHTGVAIEWTPGTPRTNVWDMGHKSGFEYWRLRNEYINGRIDEQGLRDSYNNIEHYQVEDYSSNRSGDFESK